MKLSLRRALQTVQDGVRTQLWPLPILGVALAVAAGILVPLLDVRIDQQLPGVLDTLVFNGDPGAARTVLDAVASSLITVTSLTFSLTVVTLQLASSQFSPRLLRTFTQDLFVQVTLAIFLATFTFSLTVLRSVRSALGGRSDVRPAGLGHARLPPRAGQRGRAGAVPGPPDPADPGRDDAAEGPRRRRRHDGDQPASATTAPRRAGWCPGLPPGRRRCGRPPPAS